MHHQHKNILQPRNAVALNITVCPFNSIPHLEILIKSSAISSSKQKTIKKSSVRIGYIIYFSPMLEWHHDDWCQLISVLMASACEEGRSSGEGSQNGIKYSTPASNVTVITTTSYNYLPLLTLKLTHRPLFTSIFLLTIGHW